MATRLFGALFSKTETKFQNFAKRSAQKHPLLHFAKVSDDSV